MSFKNNEQEDIVSDINMTPLIDIMLEGDRESALSLVMNVMDIAKNTGAKNFSIAAELKGQGG